MGSEIEHAPRCFAKTKRSPGSRTIRAGRENCHLENRVAANRVRVMTGKKDAEFVSPP